MVAKKLCINENCWYKNVCRANEPCDYCARYIEMSYLMEHSGLPKAKQQPITLTTEPCDEEAFDTLNDIKDDIVEFVEQGKNLYIGGFTGNGKTSWAIKLMLKYFDQIWAGNGLRTRAVFVHVPTLLLQLKDFKNPLSKEYLDSLITADLVVWDELGHGNVSAYDYANLLMYIDKRLFEEKSNIFTSNIRCQNDFNSFAGARLTSRIWGTSEIVILKGKDKRR